jgi:hypothetical protein
MKKIIYTLLAASLLVTSCKQELDIINPNNPTVEIYWNSATDAEQGVNAVYSTLHRPGLVLWQWFYYSTRSDEGYSVSPDTRIPNNMDQFQITDYDFGHQQVVWRDNYVGIFRANQVLEFVPEIEMDATLKARLLAEAKFLRAYYYYNLANIWGNVPLMLKPSSPQDMPATSPQADVWAQVTKDLTEAVADLPTRYEGKDLGRATKGAANALLAKAYMQQRNWDAALAPLEWLVTGEGNGLYDLMPNFADNFQVATENNRESVFEIQYAFNPLEYTDDDVFTVDHNVGSPLAQFTAPIPIGFSDANAHRWLVGEFEQENALNLQRDPRLPVSLLYNYTHPGGPDSTMLYGRTFSSVIRPMDFERVWFSKFLHEETQTGEGFRSQNNYRFIRYADVLLMYAEVLNELGRTAEAYQYVDRVRQRAGLAPLTLAKPGLDQASFRKQIEHERITELSGEGHRWTDIVRFGYLESQAKVNELAQRDPAFNNFIIGRHEFMPIPQRELDLNPNLDQNPNY